jgi:flagellar biosynthesis chaperone FliJ
MARTAGIELFEQKIEKAQSDVVKTKQLYEAAVSKLGDLMDKRDALKRDVLVTTIMKSKKSYEEIVRFLKDERSRRIVGRL